MSLTTKPRNAGQDRFTRVVTGLVLSLASIARCQTTQPAPDAWTALIDRLVSTLPADGQYETLAQLIPDETTIQQFDSTQTETRYRVADRLNHMSLLWQHSYVGSPTTMVSDLSNGLTDQPSLPADLRQQLVPKDPAATAKADATAQRWITRTIAPDAASLLSVMLFWDRPGGDPPATMPREPVFVLVKGRSVGDEAVVLQIRYGRMNQALN